MRPQYWLYIIFILAFGVRIIGIGYGLPLWLIGDEPPFTTAALKMLELKTVLPALHAEAFKPTLYFPPYLAYLYLLPFSALIAIKYAFFSGALFEFKQYLVSDLSAFFLLARFLSVLFGTATVYLIYRITKNIFHAELPALLSAAFLATSTLHIYFSGVARDWILAVFMFTLVIFVLSHPNFSFHKRYILAAIISGLAFGVSLIAGFPMIFILLFYLFYERHSLIDALKEKTLYVALFIFLVLAGLSIAVYPYGFHFTGDNSVHATKSLVQFLESLANFLKPMLLSEPILLIGAILGLGITYARRRNIFYTITLFVLIYATIFYWLYHYEQRYMIYFFPLLAIVAGYGFSILLEKVYSKRLFGFLLACIFILPLASVLRLDWLLLKNDSRITARRYVETHIPYGSKVLVYAEMTRLSSTVEAIKEQEDADPNSLRHVDRAEMMRMDKKSFHALNFYAIKNDDFYKNIHHYAQENHYEYFMIDPYFSNSDTFKPLLENGTLLATFGSYGGEEIPRDGRFSSFINLFIIKEFGPRIEIYTLQSK